jgi:hypothetical protein
MTLAQTRFGSRRNHHQVAVLCLAKATNLVLLCLSVQTQSMLWRHINLLCRRAVHSRERNIDCVYADEHSKTIFVVLAKHRIAPW